MQRRYSLKKNSQFAYVHRRGVSRANKYMVILHVPGQKLLVGFSVSKKLGGAVVRNHIKRLLRECVRPNLGRMKRGRYVIIARRDAPEAGYMQLRRAFEGSMEQAGFFRLPPC